MHWCSSTYRFGSVLLIFLFALFNLDCFPPIPGMLQRSFQEALKCSRYTERGTPASSLICGGSAWQGWASCSKEYPKRNPLKTLPSWRWDEFSVLSAESQRRSWNWQRAFVRSMCLAPTWFSYASKQDAFGNQSAHPYFINHLSASAKILPHPRQCLWFSRLRCLSAECEFFFCVCVWNWEGGEWIPVVAVKTLSLPLRGVSVVAPSSRHYWLVSLLACCARQPFLFLPDENIVCSWRSDASCWYEIKSICWDFTVWKSGQSLGRPFILSVPE